MADESASTGWALQQLPRGLHLDIPHSKEVILGRLPELNIRSLQVSRRHARVNLGPSSAPSITATGSNPLLVEKGRKRSLLKKGESMKLKHGYLIYLVPGDPNICFSVVQKSEKQPDTTVDKEAQQTKSAGAEGPTPAQGASQNKHAICNKSLHSPNAVEAVIDLSSPASTPRKKFTPVKQLLSPGAPSCVICTDKLDDIQGELGCGHKFCFDCIQQWARIATVCPLCKGAFCSITQLDGQQRSSVKVTPKRQRIHNDDDSHWGEEGEEEELLPCMLCDDASNEHLLLLCDGCDAPCHTYCAGLRAVPSEDWYCIVCTVERDAERAGSTAAAALTRRVLPAYSGDSSDSSASPVSLDRFALGASAPRTSSAWRSARSSASGAVGPEAAWRARQMMRAEDDLGLASSQLYVDEDGKPFIVGDDDVEFDSSQDSALDRCDRDGRSGSDASSVGSDAAAAPRRQARKMKKRRLKKRNLREDYNAVGQLAGGRSGAGAVQPAASKTAPPRVLSGASHRFGLAASGASSAATDPAEVSCAFPDSASSALPARPFGRALGNTNKTPRRGSGSTKHRPTSARSAYFS